MMRGCVKGTALAGSLSRRAFLAGLAGVLGACKGGGGGGGTTPTPVGDPTEPTAPTEVRAPSPMGYGSVLRWAHEDPIRIASLLAQHGLTLTQAEWADGLADDYGKLRAFARACAVHGVQLFVNALNWNHAPSRSYDRERFRAHVQRLLDATGPVWGEGISEPDGSELAWDLQRLLQEVWPGVKVANGLRGRGFPPFGGWDVLDWHHCEYQSALDSIPTRDWLHSTDCTPLLASNLGERRVKELTRLAAQHRRRLILYDTGAAPFDEQIARWMGEALRGA